MKRSFCLLFLFFSVLSFAQIDTNKYDFFVQYNGDQLSKKVNVTSVLNHSALKEYSKDFKAFTSTEFGDVVNLTEKTTFLGNFTDSITFTQVTIPLKNSDLLREILLRKNQTTDSLLVEKETTIINFDTFSMIQSDTINKKATVAWNKEYLVIFEFTNKYKAPDFIDDEEDYEEEYQEEADYDAEAPLPPAVPVYDENDVIVGSSETSSNDAVVIDDTAIIEEYSDEESYYDTFSKENTAFLHEQIASQERYVQNLFENGFVAPHSDKVSVKADISSWVNYSSFLESTSKMYQALGAIVGMNDYFANIYNFGDFVKGMNFNLYFDNDKVRLEETVEYSADMADTMSKISNRKINNKIYAYFPTQQPIGFASYHFDSEELWKSLPTFTNQIFNGESAFKEDMTLVMDLISTIVDEKATATLFDGDLSFFLHDISSEEVTTTVYEYDENYEQVAVEKTETQSNPVFTVVFTSTHPDFADKLINLGIRKGLLYAEGNLNYFDMKTDKYGAVYILKDKDVIVIGNYSEDFNTNGKSAVAKDIKRSLKKNSLVGAINFERIAEANQQLTNKNSGEAIRFAKYSHHFDSFQIHSPKKLKNNKFSFEMVLQATNSDQNVILQFLDVLQENK